MPVFEEEGCPDASGFEGENSLSPISNDSNAKPTATIAGQKRRRIVDCSTLFGDGAVDGDAAGDCDAAEDCGNGVGEAFCGEGVLSGS